MKQMVMVEERQNDQNKIIGNIKKIEKGDWKKEEDLVRRAVMKEKENRKERRLKKKDNCSAIIKRDKKGKREACRVK